MSDTSQAETSLFSVGSKSTPQSKFTYLLRRTDSTVGLDLDGSHDDTLVTTTALLLDHLALRAELLQDALGVAALVRVGVVVAHSWWCGCGLDGRGVVWLPAQVGAGAVGGRNRLKKYVMLWKCCENDDIQCLMWEERD